MTNSVHFGCFPFLDIKSSFFIFLAPKMGSFVKHLPKIRFKNRITQFIKYYIILYAQLTSCLHGKSFIAIAQEIDKYMSIQLKAGQI
jgi:hypothetical protein